MLTKDEIREEVDTRLWDAVEYAYNFNDEYGIGQMEWRFDEIWGVGWIQVDFEDDYYDARDYLRESDVDHFRLDREVRRELSYVRIYYVRDGAFPNWDLIAEFKSACGNCGYIRTRRDTEEHCPECHGEWQDHPWWVSGRIQVERLQSKLEQISDPRML